MASKYCENLPESARVRLHQKVGDNEGSKDIGRIVKSMYEWEGDVADALGLTVVDVASIKMLYRDELKLQLRAALQIWQEMNGLKATYHELIEVFINAGKTTYVDAVCNILKEDSAGTFQPAEHQEISPDAGTTVTPQATVEPQQIVVQGKSYGETEMTVLKKNEDEIRRAFAHLVRQLLDMLTKCTIDIKGFRVFVGNVVLGLSLRNIPSSASVSDIFEFITDNRLWSYGHYHPVESIAEEYLSDCPEKEQLIINYKKELAAFNVTTNLVDYIAKCEDREADPDVPLDPKPIKENREYYRKLSLKLKTRVTSQTLEYVDKIWRDIAEIFMLPSLSALLDSVVAGSLVITWCIPHHFAMKIIENIRGAEAEEFFRRNNIMEVKLDEEVVYYDVKMCLLGACEEGDAEKVMELLQEVADFDFSQYEYTPVGAAAGHGHTDLVQKLLLHGFEVDGRAMDGWTALVWAQPVTVDTSKYKQKLLDVILTAVHSGHADPIENAVQVLKEHCEHPIGVLQLLDFVPQKNPPINVPAAYSCHSPLMIACEKERADLVKLLLEKGASVAFRNKDKLNALHIACNKGNTEIVELLLTAARNQKKISRRKHPNDLQWMINARNERGWTPLMFAIKGGHIDTVNKLIRTGKVNYQAKTRKECIVLHFASRGTSLQCFNAILAQFKNASELIVATDKKGWNILHHACASKSVEILKQLLSQLSEDNRTKLINQHSKAGYTPLLTACEYQNEAAVKLLISHGANASLCAKDDDEKGGEKSGLHVAAIHDAKDIAKLLLDKKCPIDTKDSEGNSPLHVAYKKSSFEVIAILRQADDGKLERLKNKAGVLASDIVPDDIIPPEIKKRGKEAIDLYKKALREGKKKIPRCSLLILGEQRVGKTSVYRLLVGLGFNREQNPTLGIENKAVDTVDMRFLDIESWVEKSDDVQKEQSKELFAEGVVAEVRDKFPPKRKDPKLFEPVSEEQLMREVEDIKVEIERKIKEITTPAVNVLESDFQSMLLSHATQVPSHAQQPHHANTEDRRIDSTATPPHEILNPKSAPIKEHSKTRTHFPEKTQAARPEPTRVDQPKKPPVRDTHQHTRSVSDQPAPPIPTTDPLPAVVQPIVNRKHRHSINERLKSNFPQAEEEPSLILNTLDFAGQPEYRPMHHCFITRRAMYLVVFNLQNMVKYLKNKDSKSGDDDVLNPLEEVRYWLHSIHAHIYPPDEDERGRDEKMSRVCLVGTHRAPKDQEQGSEITEDELNTVDELLREELLLDDRCVDHIHCMEGRKRIFVAVENSIDRKDAKDREESGAKLLQHKLKSISSHLIFLKEDYPIVWLQFESELMRQREYQKQRSLSMVVKLEELQRWAHQQGIATPEAQNLAFQFFHDTGKIVYLKQIPKLFLNDEERDQLADLVILDPAWLIKVIKVIFEMKQSFQGVPGRLVRDLNGSGIASSTLLKACWEKFTHKGPASFHQLCLMLQANCLIYPVESLPCPMRAETDPLPSSSHLPTTPARSQTSPETDDSEKFFLVPCKLPEKTCEALKADCRLPWIRFYFDFQKFLPNEIYHRFICLMLAVSESNKSKKKKNTYFSTCCQFYNIDGCNWKIELEQSLHRLKVSVLAKEGDERPPSYYITKVHTEYLQKICQDSNLQGLEYYGGPLVKCDCGEEEIVEFVGYADGRTQKPRFELWCTSCPKKHDVDELLKPQISVPQTTKDSETGRNKQSRSVEEDSSTPPLAGAAQNSTLLPTNTSSSKDEALSSSTLTLKRLTIIKWKDAKGEDQKSLRILRTIGPKWREAGRILDIEAPVLESISMKHQKDPGECCCEVFSMWLDGGYSSDYPVSWAGLIEFLEDMQSKHLADNLRKALQFLNIVY